MRILVLNCYSRNSLAIINSLRSDWELVGGAVERDAYLLMKPDRFFRHRRLQAVVRHRDPKVDEAGFVEDIVCYCRDLGVDAVMASGTSITNSLSKCKQQIEVQSGVRVLVEDYEKLSRLTDKWNAYQIALEVGVRVPRTVLLDGSEAMMAALAELSYPVVLKPRMSFAAIGVEFFDTHAQLLSYLEKLGKTGDAGRNSTLIVQEMIKGDLCDVTGCAQQGRAISLLSQRRLKTLYDFGGGGIVNITTDEPVPREYARAIMAHVEWNGACEFDFIVDDHQNYYMLECNPKIWGTTHLTVSAGMNVVQQMADLFLEPSIELPAVEEYEVGLQYVWFFPECLFNWIQKPRTLSNLRRRIKETFDRRAATRVMSSFRLADFRHQVGVVLDKAQL